MRQGAVADAQQQLRPRLDPGSWRHHTRCCVASATSCPVAIVCFCFANVQCNQQHKRACTGDGSITLTFVWARESHFSCSVSPACSTCLPPNDQPCRAPTRVKENPGHSAGVARAGSSWAHLMAEYPDKMACVTTMDVGWDEMVRTGVQAVKQWRGTDARASLWMQSSNRPIAGRHPQNCNFSD